MNRTFLKKLYSVKLVCYSLLLMLCLKLYSLMVLNHEEISRLAEETNTISLSVTTDRNDICDRHMRKLTGVNLSKYAVIFSSGNNENDFNCCKFISEFTKVDEYSLYNDLRKFGKVYVLVSNSEALEKANTYSNVKVISLNTRYSANSP